MARPRTVHRCSDCGAASPQWVGRCPTCGEWNTLVEEVETRPSPAEAWSGWGAAGPVAPVSPSTKPVDGDVAPVPTGVDELDRVLSGGLVPGSVTLLAGAPGTGKSTLALQVAGAVAAGGATVLYACAEESPAQVRRRAQRLDAHHDRLWLSGEALLPRVLADIDDIHFARLTSADVVRHTLVGQIVDAYTKYDAEKQLQKFESVQSPRKRDRRFGR